MAESIRRRLDDEERKTLRNRGGGKVTWSLKAKTRRQS